MTATIDDVLEGLVRRLPAHLVHRDEESGGLLRALLRAVAAELDLLEDDLEALYDAWFVETCAEWVLPYLADLVGVAELPPDFGAGTSRRAFVANTVAYRRRKGTVAVLEQVAHDVTGWPARAVEFYRLLGATAHINHVRLDRAGIASLRGADRLDLTALDQARSPALAVGLDPLPHTVEVRRISSRRGRYGIPAVGVFLYPTRVYEVDWSQAHRAGNGFTADSLGRKVPWFAAPAAEEAVEHLAAESDLPVPLRPRRLLAVLRAARAGELDPARLPVGLRIGTDGIDLPPNRIRVCGLEDPDAATPVGQWQAMVDPRDGRITCYDGTAVASPESVSVRYAYGGLADVGAGTYDRTGIHQAALVSDSYRGRPEVDAQVGVRAGTTQSPPSNQEVETVAEALATASAHWTTSGDGGTYVISIGDNASYPQALNVELPPATRLVIVAAAWASQELPHGEVRLPEPGAYSPDGLVPHMTGPLTVTGGSGSSLVLDGVVIDGDVVIAPGDLGSLTVTQSTLTGMIRVNGEPGAANANLRVRIQRSIIGGVELPAPVPELTVADSVITGAVTGASVHAMLDGSTVFGAAAVRSLDASSCVFDSAVKVEHRQLGCLRFSFAAPGSHTPRRFRCAPESAQPVFASREPGSPVFAALSPDCPSAVRAGGEHSDEMGVHHHLRRASRTVAAERALAPYIPVQIELGIFGS